MAYYRSKLAGEVAVTAGSSGAGTAASMPNFGTSHVTGTTGADAYVLQAPVAGCKKRVVFHALTSANLQVLRSCTSGGDNISFVSSTTGVSVLTLTTIRANQVTVIDLEGYNSTSWIVTNCFPATSIPIVAYTS
jgi:hypothetical protein